MSTLLAKNAEVLVTMDSQRMDDGARGPRARHAGRRSRAWTLRHRVRSNLANALTSSPSIYTPSATPARCTILWLQPLFCAPQSAKFTIINGKVIVRDGEVVTMDMKPVIETHNRCASEMANALEI